MCIVALLVVISCINEVKKYMIRISESDNFIVDYDKSKGMYRVSVFNSGHFWDEYWFDAYEEKEVGDNFTDDVEYVIVGENEVFDNCLVCVIGESRTKAEGVLHRMLNDPSGNDKRIIGDLVNLHIMAVDKKDCWWHDNCD